MDAFGKYSWVPTKPEHLDYVNTQLLLIGEKSGVEKATEPSEADQKQDKDEPLEELEKLEDEDADRMNGLSEDDSRAIFQDLHALSVLESSRS